MDMAELEKLVEERKKQSERREIGHKVRVIARQLGSGFDDGGRIDSESEYTYLDKDFRIHNEYRSCEEGFGGDSSVAYKDRIVYKHDYHSLKVYIPGNWERGLNSLYRDAIAKREEKVKLDNQRDLDIERLKVREQRARFGL